LSKSKLLELQEIDAHIGSLDEPVGDEAETTRADFLAGAVHYNADFGVNRKSFHQDLRRVLDYLPEKERVVMELLYGFNEWEREFSTIEVGELLGISRERVRQYKERAINRLRKKVDLSFLRHYRAA